MDELRQLERAQRTVNIKGIFILSVLLNTAIYSLMLKVSQVYRGHQGALATR